jgi:hypothetical protein
MGRLVVSELKTIRKYLPETYEKMVEAGAVDIVLAIDNHSRHNFCGHSKKLEQAVIKIVLPDIDSAQHLVQMQPTGHRVQTPMYSRSGVKSSCRWHVGPSISRESIQKVFKLVHIALQVVTAVLVGYHGLYRT